MIIIVEGPDGSGKTTLCKDLTHRFNLTYRHEGPPPRDICALEYYGSVLDANRHARLVLDRFALGELVYGPLIRGTDRLGGLEGWRVFRRLVMATGALQILCLPPYETCYWNWKGRKGEMFTDNALFQATYKAFQKLSGVTNQFIYDYTDPQANERLNKYFESTASEVSRLSYGMVGNPRAKVLLVGDIGSNPKSLHDLPFFATENSSLFLTRALDAACINDNEWAMMNVYRHQSKEAVLVPTTFQRVVALGIRASNALRKQNIKHTLVPHPQFWRRFHSREISRYAELLQRAIRGI